ncbi:zinc finger protein 595-like [Liolophura sinensis]|uniref:zinc finger protein 595-like n=1 Tax=Liolophura sinensis TaxID=3198878 RepID=UPI003158AB19
MSEIGQVQYHGVVPKADSLLDCTRDGTSPVGTQTGSSRRKQKTPGRAVAFPKQEPESDGESTEVWTEVEMNPETRAYAHPASVLEDPRPASDVTTTESHSVVGNDSESEDSSGSEGGEGHAGVAMVAASETKTTPVPVCLFKNTDIAGTSENYGSTSVDESKIPSYSCHICQQNFIGEHILQEHLKIHGIKPELSFPCHICGKVLTREKYLTKHLKIHARSALRPFSCKTCGSSFGSRKNLRQHERIHKKNKPLKCPKCPKRFDFKGGLMTHLAKHNEHRPYVCPECPQAFKTKDTLTRHVRRGQHLIEEEDEDTKESESIQKSEDASRNNFTKITSLDAAKTEPKRTAITTPSIGTRDSVNAASTSDEVENGTDKMKFNSYGQQKCERTGNESVDVEMENYFVQKDRKCVYGDDNSSGSGTSTQKDTPEESRMDPVLEVKTEKEADPCLPEKRKKKAWNRSTFVAVKVEPDVYVCFTCRKKCFSSEEFQDHLKQHTSNKPFVCWQCGRGLTSRTSLNRHMITHSTEKPLTCEVCGKGFIYNCDLQDHKRSHTGERPFVCPVCGKTFATRGIFNGHKKLHSEEKTHICPECLKGFVSKRALKRHMFSHTNARPFQCDVCPQGFKCAGGLKRHMRRHEGIITHVCEFCNRGFGHLTDYQRHVRIHTGERPFTCEVCGKGFKQNHHLSDHVRTHTGEKPYQCQYCPQRCATKSGLQKHHRRHGPEGDLPIDKISFPGEFSDSG